MSGTPRAGSYRRLLTDSTIARTFLLAAVGRCGYAMLPLLLLFTVDDATGSFGVAALSLSGYGLATLAMPLKSRLVDRHGQRAVLPPLAVALGLVLLAAAVAAAAAPVSGRCWVAFGVATGLTAPPLGPSMRAQWRRLAPHDVESAYSLDAVTEEVLWLLGPLVAGGGLALGPARQGLLAVPVLIGVGAAALAASPAQHGQLIGAGPRRRGGALGHRRLWPVLALMAASGAAGSLLVTGIAARAAAAGRPGFVGVAEAVLAAGAVLGGLAWGRLHPRSPWPVSAGFLLLAWGALVAVSDLAGLGPVLLVLLVAIGLLGAPLWVIAYVAADDAVPADARTEAGTWVTTVANLGSSAGTATAGLLAAEPLLGPALTAGILAACSGLLLLGAARSAGGDSRRR